MTAGTLVLAGGVREALLDHVREGHRADPPAEVCGVLAGQRGVDRARDDATAGDEGSARRSTVDRVTEVRRVPNVASDPRTRYELDPEAALAAIDDLEDAGSEVVGFYHSHPAGPPRPSATDRAQATWRGYVYLVVSPRGDGETFGAWRWTGESFDRLAVEVASG